VKLHGLPTISAQRLEWIVVYFGAGDDRYLFVKKVSQLPYDPALGLTSQTKEYEIVPGKDRIYELRHD
jgi:hypothetical protein